MKAVDSPGHHCDENQEQVRKVAKLFNTKSDETLVKRSIKVLNSERHSLANWASTSDNHEAVAEITSEIAECTNTTKSCIEQNTFYLKGTTHKKHDDDCNLQKTELDDTAVQEISTQEHFESLDISQVSDFWDQVQLEIGMALNNELSFYFISFIIILFSGNIFK